VNKLLILRLRPDQSRPFSGNVAIAMIGKNNDRIDLEKAARCASCETHDEAPLSAQTAMMTVDPPV
jgi:hypothetical protein